MASTQATPNPKPQARAVETKQDPLLDGFRSAMQVGAATGVLGVFVGAVSGIARGSKTPLLWTAASGLQWFAQGSTFYGSRQLLLAAHGPVDKATPSQKLHASTLGAAISQAALAGLLRGRRSILPAALASALFASGGQMAVNMWTSSRKDAAEIVSGDWLGGKWSPMTKLTDQQYENILEEKILRLDAEIAIIDENIAALRAQLSEQVKDGANATPQPPPVQAQA